MNRTDAPVKQSTPFAVNGQREPILPTTPAGDNTASYAEGFPAITMILKSAGGLPPKGQDMNQILFELSALARWASSGATNAWDAAFSTAIGGYPMGAVVLGTDGVTQYKSTADSNVTNPNTGGAGWFNLTTGYLKTASNLGEINAAGPTAVAATLLNLGLGDGHGRLTGVQTFTSSGTYTPTAGTNFVIVEVLGGGGGGGSNASTPSAGFSAGGGGGGAGGYAKSKSAAGTFSVVVGAGGAGGVSTPSGANGGSGGASSFGAVVSPGGNGGIAGQAFSVFPTGGQSALASGMPSGANIIQVQGAGGGICALYSSVNATSAAGASSQYGSGGRQLSIATSTGKLGGDSAKGYGSGGGGSVSVSEPSATSQVGGAGAPGIVVVWEYA